jgi:DNA polymerase I
MVSPERGLIKPEPGRAVAYVDWSQEEFGIAASLSGDAAMIDAYQSGDPYLAFGQQVSAAAKGGATMAAREDH